MTDAELLAAFKAAMPNTEMTMRRSNGNLVMLDLSRVSSTADKTALFAVADGAGVVLMCSEPG